MDLPKASDIKDHQLLIATSHAYNFSTEALEVLLRYLQDRWQRVKINTTFISWHQLELCKSQSLVPYYLIFTSMICFFALKGIDICNFADDVTPFVSNSDLKSVLETLKVNSELTRTWFEMNYMKLNKDKCHLLISGNKNEQMWANVDKYIAWESNNVKLRGITIDNNLKFDKHMSNISSKANRKLSALTRVATFLPFKKGHILIKVLLSHNLNIAQSYRCFMEGKLIW